MNRGNRLLIGAGCVALLLISWIITANSESKTDKQARLMTQAAELMDSGIYIRAVPLLEEAAAYETAVTSEVETQLKEAYIKLMDQSGFRRKYTELLSKQMNRNDAPCEVYEEAAEYYLSISRLTDALAILSTGIGKTGSMSLIDIYEANRYVYGINRTVYENVAAAHGSTVQVQSGGLWGIANVDGTLLIPCQYEKISTFSKDRAIVRSGGDVFAIDRDNNRIAILDKEKTAADIGNFAADRITLLIDGRWHRATGELILGAATYDYVGMHSETEGYAAAMLDGKWGVVDISAKWVVTPEHDGIIMDELGCAFGQRAVFVRNGGSVTLLVGGEQVGDAYEDARPFGAEGYAAVKQNGQWGFINNKGEVMIGFDPRIEDALSFGQHLAAVRIDGLWGYMNIYGDIVIEPEYLQAKSFSEGSAPVRTERGWQFITLIEYKKGATL